MQHYNTSSSYLIFKIFATLMLSSIMGSSLFTARCNHERPHNTSSPRCLRIRQDGIRTRKGVHQGDKNRAALATNRVGTMLRCVYILQPISKKNGLLKMFKMLPARPLLLRIRWYIPGGSSARLTPLIRACVVAPPS